MQRVNPQTDFIPSGTATTSLATGLYGIGYLLGLPAVDSSNLLLSVANKGEHTLQVVIGALAPLAFSYQLAASIRVGPNRTVLLSEADVVGVSTATQVSISSSGQGCVATFQRGSLSTLQVAS